MRDAVGNGEPIRRVDRDDLRVSLGHELAQFVVNGKILCPIVIALNRHGYISRAVDVEEVGMPASSEESAFDSVSTSIGEDRIT